MEQSLQPMPTKKGWPLLGVLPKLLSGDPFDYLKSLMLKHGGFVKLNIATKPVYLVSDPNHQYNMRVLPNQSFPARVGSTRHPRNGVKVLLSLRENS